MYADDTAILARNKNPKCTAAAINQHLEKLGDRPADVASTVPDRRTRGSPHHHPARQSASELPPFPLLPHRDSNHQNPAAQIVKYSTCHTGD
ncbi:hypothetical protein AVEN_167958-1 [Araneus ventricosus]|uniref:Uncharacterized protein n=1 Tax=Araneus ventricosus TaxID=182803 RepID=A0A4Y2WN32_ARAVE|nr:hypothetical protein AVEN_167958-1 [Araneus ventricosus]